MLAHQFGESRVAPRKVDGKAISSTTAAQLFGIRPTTTAGVDVNEVVARNFTLFASAIIVLSRALSKPPLIVSRRLKRGKEPWVDHPLYPLMRTEPNPDMSSIDWRQRVWSDFLVHGNHLSLAGFRHGHVERFDPVPWPQVEVVISKRTGRPLYAFEPLDGGGEFIGGRRFTEKVAFRPEEVLHFKSGGSGILGDPTVQQHAQTIGTMIATDRYAGSFFGNGAWLGGVLQHPGVLKGDAQARLVAQWNALHQGPENAFRTAVLEEGMQYQQVTADPDKAQLSDTKRDHVRDMARMFNLPPHKLADLEDAHFANMEQGDKGFHDSLCFFAEVFEQEFDRKFLDKGVEAFIEHDFTSLLRADSQGRAELYQTMSNWGGINANEMREREGYNPREGGDRYFVPMNMVPTDRVDDALDGRIVKQAPNAQNQGNSLPLDDAGTFRLDLDTSSPARTITLHKEQRSLDSRFGLREAFTAAFRQVTGRIVSREVGEIRKAIRRVESRAEFLDWIVAFYVKHSDFYIRELLPVVESYTAAVSNEATFEVLGPQVDSTAFSRDYAANDARGYATSAQAELRALLADAEDEFKAAVLERVEKWKKVRADHMTSDALTEAGARVSMLAYAAAGITLFKWRANPDACPVCKRMDGRVVGSQKAFLGKGEPLIGGDGKTLMTAKRTVRYPPLHTGNRGVCQCSVSPG